MSLQAWLQNPSFPCLQSHPFHWMNRKVRVTLQAHVKCGRAFLSLQDYTQQLFQSEDFMWKLYKHYCRVYLLQQLMVLWGFPSSSNGKACDCNTGDQGSTPGSGRSPGEGNGNPCQYPCLENPMDKGAWWARVHGVTKSSTWLSY